MKPTQAQTSQYGPHPMLERQAAFLRDLKKKTGKDVAEWMALIHKSAPGTQKARRVWLKEKHGLGLNYASFFTEIAENGGKPLPYAPEAYVEEIFAGSKSSFRAIFDEIMAFALTLGNDVKVCPCQTIIPFYRNHVFAQVRVPNRSRLDLGLALGNFKPAGRLIDTGGLAKKDRITHRIEITTSEEFNTEAKRSLKHAYAADI